MNWIAALALLRNGDGPAALRMLQLILKRMNEEEKHAYPRRKV